MLEELPEEVLLNIIAYLPTIAAITSLAQTSRRFHTIVTGDDQSAFRIFVQRSFPSIKTTTRWREAAEALTSRSRAWDRRALVVRDCCPPETLSISAQDDNRRRITTGFAPALDSYENLLGNSLSGRTETVAWGAAGRIYVRTSDKSSINWHSIKFEDDHLAHNDILQLRLLRPHQTASTDETMIFRRDNGEIATLVTSDSASGYEQYARFVDAPGAHTMAVSNHVEPLLAVARTAALQLYNVNTPQDQIKPFARLRLPEMSDSVYRTRCMQFLDSTNIVLGTAFLEGTKDGPVSIYDINHSTESSDAVPIWSCVPPQRDTRARQYVHALTPLDHVCGNFGQMFLSGWSSGHARLHDTRAPNPWVADWYDSVDNGQILSLAAIGHERFVAGSDQNACLKLFDMRMPGDQRYSYLDARPAQNPRQGASLIQNLIHRPVKDRRDWNAFLSVRKWTKEALWVPLPMPRQHNGTVNYSGSVYSLSVPSPTSPTIYAGIENHVLQLDLVNTDDLERGRIDPLLSSLAIQKDSHVFGVGCYERPRKGKESTDPVLLNKQAMWHELKSQPERNEESEAAGWDRRWRLGGTRRSSWSRGRPRGRGGRRGSTGNRQH